MAAISILVNGEHREVETGTSLELLLERLGLPRQRIAIELNGEVIRRSDWRQTKVEAGDNLEVVHFVGGG